ncbi:hypothetical protein [Ancylobacter lacus]|uniref:hypothetical protein n=1 Tax=Ancylobacter lacus TaxID=2579970 RepID=UPI001BCD7929|nr:hypothetical protein [Ancylobacter lacus]MBS7538104.1 hypothetical protein [Ancylobacter lacus]
MTRSLTRLAAAAGLASLVSIGMASSAFALTGAEFLAQYNKDGDQTLEIPEAIDLGTKTFHAINPDGDTTLEPDETEGRLTKKDWAKINKDGDQTLELDEYLSLVRARFNAADKNKDGKLTAKELDSKAGQSLLKLIVK